MHLVLPPARCALRLRPNLLPITTTRCASHAAQGVANGPKQGPGKRLGAKKGDSEPVVPGNILFRQRGSLWYPGENTVMGRDHTISALVKGFVRYYRDPARHSGRKYIGVVFEQKDRLPRPPNAPRKRRLGLEPVVMEEVGEVEVRDGAELAMRSSLNASTRPSIIKGMRQLDTPKGAAPVLRNDYRFQETNTSIGRIPERAGKRDLPWKAGNRFAAWRRRSAKQRQFAQRAVLKKKGKKKRQ